MQFDEHVLNLQHLPNALPKPWAEHNQQEIIRCNPKLTLANAFIFFPILLALLPCSQRQHSVIFTVIKLIKSSFFH